MNNNTSPEHGTPPPASHDGHVRYVIEKQMCVATTATLAVAANYHELELVGPNDQRAASARRVLKVDVLLSDDRISETADAMTTPPLVVPRIDVRLHLADGSVDHYDTDVCFHRDGGGTDGLPTTTPAVGTKIEDIAHRMAQASTGLPAPGARQREAALMRLRNHPMVGDNAQGVLLTRAVEDSIAPLVGNRWSGIVIEWNRAGATLIHYRKR